MLANKVLNPTAAWPRVRPNVRLRLRIVNDRHAAREIAIFRSFVTAAGLAVDDESIEKRIPPEPDILCRLGDSAYVAFELVEIIEQSHAKRTTEQSRLKARLDQGYVALSVDEKSEICASVGNALIYINFVDDANFNVREQTIQGILETLKTVDPNFEGELTRHTTPRLHAAICSIGISRLSFKGPFFDVAVAGSLGDPTSRSIAAKWSKAYATPHPIELVAYYELQPDPPEILWRPELESFLAANWSNAPFRRVWVYDCATQAIRFSLIKPGL